MLMLGPGVRNKMVTVDTVDSSEIPFPTTWDVQSPVNNGIFTISAGDSLAGDDLTNF